MGLSAEEIALRFGEPEDYVQYSYMEYGVHDDEWMSFSLLDDDCVFAISSSPEKFTFDGKSLADNYNGVLNILGESFEYLDYTDYSWEAAWEYSGYRLIVTFSTDDTYPVPLWITLLPIT